MSKPVKINLKSELDEISGLFYYPNDTSLFAINDETGLLYKLHLKYKNAVQRWKFAKKSDFEDLYMIDSTFYALESDGDITTFKFISLDSVQVQEYKMHLKGKNEFESLYYDTTRRQMILLCKDCAEDNKKTSSAYGFDPFSGTYIDGPVFTLDAKEISSLFKDDKERFKPSAAAIHPITHELYILSAINKAIVVCDRNGHMKNVYNLDPGMFLQAEGLAFGPNGDMYISNESSDFIAANILIFKYKVKRNEKG